MSSAETGRQYLLYFADEPPEDSSDAYQSRYGPGLKTALLQASQVPGSSLDIAVTYFSSTVQRTQVFSRYQNVIAKIYSLACSICSENGIDPVKPGYVDIRVYIVNETQTQDPLPSSNPNTGPICSLATLALSDRPWDIIFVSASPRSQLVKERFAKLRRDACDSNGQIEVLETSDSVQRTAEDIETPTGPLKDHHTVIVAGTFDNLHEGHKLLLSASALVLQPGHGESQPRRRLMIGITGEDLLKNKKYKEVLESWDDRQSAVFEFLIAAMSLKSVNRQVTAERRDEPGPNGKARLYHLSGSLTIECVEIQDPYGPTITDESITALVVSAETRSGGKAVNEKRNEKGWASLQVFEVDVLGPSGSSDLQDKLSSTEKRRRRLEAASSVL